MIYYFVKIIWSLILILDFVVLTTAMYVVSFLPKSWLQGFYHPLFRFWCKAFVHALGVDLRLHQKNLKPLPEHYILIANHPSAFEDIGVPSLFNVYSLAKVELRDWPILGRISWAAGTLYVKRESKESRNAAMTQIIEELNDGKNVALYPEGGCKGRRLFESFRYGAFDISLQTGIPVLPVFLHYEAQETFEWTAPHTLVHKLWHFLSGQNNRANYYVFDAIDPSQFKDTVSYNRYVYQLYLEWQQKYLE